MPTRIIQDQPTTTYVRGGGASGMNIMLMSVIGLIVVGITVLLILHFTVGVA